MAAGTYATRSRARGSADRRGPILLVLGAIGTLTLAGCDTTPAVPVNDTHAVATAASLAPPRAPIVAGQPAPVVGHPDPLSLLRSADPMLAANKRLVFDFWRSVLNAGRLELIDELLAEDYIQHSPVLPTGRAALKRAFSVVERRDAIPELVEPPLVTLIAEGDLVAMALVERLREPDGSGDYTTTHFNLFRIANGRLAEHWHSIQGPPAPNLALPEDGGSQPVAGATGAAQLALLGAADRALANNERLVFDAWRHIFDAGRIEFADLYLEESYVSHNPNAAAGRDGRRAYLAARPASPLEPYVRRPLVAMLAEGDVVVQAIMLEHPHPTRAGRTYTTTWFDMFRIADGRLAEHWDESVKPAPAATDAAPP